MLTGAGRGFCAGLDLGGFGMPPHTEHLGPTQRGFAVQRLIANVIPHLRSLPQPVIAAVNGPAAGGGFAFVLGSDVRLAARSARFNAAFIRIGLSACDIGTSWLLPRLVGVARAQELMVTGRIFDAEEAYRIGLVVDLVDDDALLDVAYAKADEIMLNTPFGVALTKEGMWSALEIPGMQPGDRPREPPADHGQRHRRPPRGDAGLPRTPPARPTPTAESIGAVFVRGPAPHEALQRTKHSDGPSAQMRSSSAPSKRGRTPRAASSAASSSSVGRVERAGRGGDDRRQQAGVARRVEEHPLVGEHEAHGAGEGVGVVERLVPAEAGPVVVGRPAPPGDRP